MSDIEPPVDIDIRHRGDQPHVVLRGELDLVSTPVVRSTVADLMGDDPNEVHLDVAGLTFVDSVGLSFLLVTHRELEVEGRRLVLDNPSAPVTRLLQLTGTDMVFDIRVG
jgi:anti-anti-sigma factor